MSASVTVPRLPEIGLSGATYLELALEALRDGDHVRAVGALAAIDSAAWEGILARFPNLATLVTSMEASR